MSEHEKSQDTEAGAGSSVDYGKILADAQREGDTSAEGSVMVPPQDPETGKYIHHAESTPMLPPIDAETGKPIHSATHEPALPPTDPETGKPIRNASQTLYPEQPRVEPKESLLNRILRRPPR